MTSQLKKLFFRATLTLMFTMLSAPVLAESITQQNQMSIGAFYGNNLGASATYNWKKNIFIDVAGSMEFDGDKNAYAWGDILWRQGRIFGVSKYDVKWYYGGGVKFRSENDPYVEQAYYLGPRGVAGLHSHIYPMPLEVYVEAGISQYLIEASKNEFDFAIGARYYF